MLNCTVHDKIITLCNIYAPNEDSPEFFHKLINTIETFQNRDIVIIGGDFNLVMQPEKDHLNSDHNNHKSLTTLNEIMEKTELTDIWRVLNPDKHTYTWCHGKGNDNKISASRIDMFLVSDAYCDCIYMSAQLPMATELTIHLFT